MDPENDNLTPPSDGCYGCGRTVRTLKPSGWYCYRCAQTDPFARIGNAIHRVGKEVAACAMTDYDREQMHDAVERNRHRLNDLDVLIDSTGSVTDDALKDFLSQPD